MFFDFVDLGFEDILKKVKDDLNNESYSNLIFKDYKRKIYYHRTAWPDELFLRLDIVEFTKDGSELMENWQELSIKEILNKIECDKILPGFALLFCKNIDGKLIEDHEIFCPYRLSPDDMFLNDWCYYIVK